MDIREKIGQRLVFGFPGTTVPAEFAALVREYKIGNVILFRYNIESLPQLARLCADIQELVRGATGRDAFITIDQEGGMVTRLPWDAVNVPGSMALAATGKPENAVLAAEITARQLRGVGVNFNLAPDLDVNSNPMNPVIGVRSFGDDPERVALFGAKAVEGYKNGGMLCCGKHFPGHGDTAVDSHIGLPCIEKTMDELEACELISFRAAIKAGIPAIMSSHILFPNIEPNGVPATMSRTIMHDLLRETLGFDGLILSDCMVMDAIRRHYGTAHGVVEAMRAGVDMVFVSSNADLQRESAAAALAAAESGSIDARELDGSAERILRAKERWIHPAGERRPCRGLRRCRAHGARGGHCGARQGVPGKRKDVFLRLRRLPHDAGIKRRPGGESVPGVYGRAFRSEIRRLLQGPGREGDRGSRQMRGRSGKYHLFLLQRAPLPRSARSRGGARRKGRADDRGGASQPLRSSAHARKCGAARGIRLFKRFSRRARGRILRRRLLRRDARGAVR